jgi:hypothetical protein
MWIWLIVIGVLAAGNAVVTWRLWRSAVYEPGQQVAQTFLIWLVPGSAIFVNQVMVGEDRDDRTLDPTGPQTAGPQIEWDTPPHDPPVDGQ